MNTEKPDFLYFDVNAWVASRLSMRMTSLSLSDRALARLAGLGADRIAEFLTGKVRIPAAALYTLAAALEVNVHYFFDGVLA